VHSARTDLNCSFPDPSLSLSSLTLTLTLTLGVADAQKELASSGGIFSIVPLLNSPNVEKQTNSAWALAALTMGGRTRGPPLSLLLAHQPPPAMH
jgi:hypothetical protein